MNNKGRYKHEIPLDLSAALPACALVVGPLRPPRPKACGCNSLDCDDCWNAGVRYGDYEKQKRLEEL